MHGNEEKRLIRVKTEKREKADLEFEMEISAGGKLVSGDKEDRNIECLAGWVEEPTCKERSSSLKMVIVIWIVLSLLKPAGSCTFTRFLNSGRDEGGNRGAEGTRI